MKRFAQFLFVLCLFASVSFATNVTYTFTQNNQTIFVNSTIPSFYIYEGGSTDRSNGVLSLFDDFSGSSVNASLWGIDGTPTVAGGSIYVSSGGGSDEDIYSLTPYPKTTTYVSLCNVTNNLGVEISHGFRDPPAFSGAAMYYTGSGGSYDNRPFINNGGSTFGTSQPSSFGSMRYFKVKRFDSWAEFYIDNNLISNLSATYPTGVLLAYLNARQQILQCDWVGIYDSGKDPTIAYGAKEMGSWAFGAETFTARTQVNLSDTGTIAMINATTITGRNLLISNETPSATPPSSASINITLNSPASGYSSTNNTVALNYSVNFTQYSSVVVVLYMNGSAIFNDTIATNTTFLKNFTSDYNSYSWYVFAYNASNITQNTTSAANTFNIYYLLKATQNTPTNGATQQNKTVFFTYDANSTLPNGITAKLYLDNNLIATNTSAANATYNNSYTTTFGVHSWFVRLEDATNASRVNTTGNFTIEVSFAVSSVSPASGTSLSGNTVNFVYATSNLHPINCTTYIDGVAANNQMVASSSTINTAQTVANGSHYWLTACAGDDAPTYFHNTTNRTFSINFYAFNTQANLTSSPENVLASPQALFFDINGNLNVLYFTDEGTSRTVRIKTISGSTVTNSANLTLEPTAQFFIVFRNPTNTTILTRNATDSTKGILLTLAGNVLTQDNITLPNSNVLNLTVFDAYTYANTKAYPTLAPTASSYWLYTTPIASGSNLTKWNGTATNLLTFVNSVSSQWQTIANESTLNTWLYVAPVNSGGNNVLHVYSYNGTGSTDIAILDPNAYSTAITSNAIVGFEKYSNKTYAYATNISARTTILLIEENKTYQINQSITNPSYFLFIDQYTFVFFATSGGDTYAYSCYFKDAPVCDRLASSDYGLAVPYEQGFMSSAKRDALNQDTVVKGMIQSGSVVQLNYNINTYDMKFICYDEQTDIRKTFKQRTITASTSNALLNYSWGYVLPSASVGAGLKKYYSTCLNGTQRLFLSGLTANFSIDEYSLLSTQGVYYSFTIKDRYGSPIQDAKISMLRFSNAKQAFVVIEQCISDFNGGCVFFLEPYNAYKILIEANGYTTQYVDFIPSSVTTINIALDASGTSFSLPNYNYIFGDLTTSLSPINTLMNNATNITFTVASNASELQYYGMSVWQTVNGTRTLVYSNNVSTQPSGGSILYPVTANGRYDVQVYAKHQNFSIYEPFTTAYNFQGKSGLVKARDTLTGSSEISGWGLYFLGVIVTMVVVGFVSRYTIDGAGIVGVLVLWGFTLLDPTGVLYTAGAVVITTTIATTITSIAAFGALYLRYSASTGG